MLEVSPSSLDARELLSRPIDQFHAKSYEVGGDFRMLWGIMDIYLQRLDPATRGAQSADIIPLESHSTLYRDTRQKLYLEITRIPGFDIAKIQSINISPSGILSIKYIDRVDTVNLIDRWNSILLPPSSENQNIKNQSKSARENLEKEVSTESLYDGSVLISYIPATVLSLLSAHALYDGGKKSTDTTRYIIDKITIRGTDGRMRVIELSDVYSGTKESIKGSIVKILEKTGYMWDVVSKGWLSPIEQSLEMTKKDIKKLTYKEYKNSQPTTVLTESEYNGFKGEVLDALEKGGGVNWNQRLSSIAKMLSKNAGEIFFFPIFFRHFNTYQSSATLIAGMAELGTFTLGAKYGAKYIRLPGFFRVLSPLIAGGVATVASHMGAEAMDITRKKWQYLSTDGFGSLYSKGKSTAGHLALGWGIQEGIDLLNNAAQKVADVTDIPSDDIDVGIPRIEIPLPGGRYLGTIPEVNMFQSTVSFGTAPWEWVRSARGRNIDDWNKKVDLYKPVLLRRIIELLGKYQSDTSMFGSKGKIEEAGSKEKLLEMHLRDIVLGGGESNAFAGEGGSMIREIIAYISQDPKLIRKKTIEDIIKNRVDQMYVDDLFLEKRTTLLKYTETTILPDLAKQLSTRKDLFIYLNSIPEKMLFGKPLFPKPKLEKTTVLGTVSNIHIQHPEGIIYQQLLDNKNPITINFPNFSGETTVGNAFAMYLEEVLKYSREAEFLTELKKGNKKGVEWSL